MFGWLSAASVVSGNRPTRLGRVNAHTRFVSCVATEIGQRAGAWISRGRLSTMSK